MRVVHREHTPLGPHDMAQDASGNFQALSSDPLPHEPCLSIPYIWPWFTHQGGGCGHLGRKTVGCMADDGAAVVSGG